MLNRRIQPPSNQLLVFIHNTPIILDTRLDIYLIDIWATNSPLASFPLSQKSEEKTHTAFNPLNAKSALIDFSLRYRITQSNLSVHATSSIVDSGPFEGPDAPLVGSGRMWSAMTCSTTCRTSGDVLVILSTSSGIQAKWVIADGSLASLNGMGVNNTSGSGGGREDRECTRKERG